MMVRQHSAAVRAPTRPDALAPTQTSHDAAAHGRPSFGLLLAFLPLPMLGLSLILAAPAALGLELWPLWVAAVPLLAPSALAAATLAPLLLAVLSAAGRRRIEGL